ncbi:hypothetical protein DPMN_134365 [Dreissena polymorpha]|uniref:Uncharacterized protein n=1 Tax=Dreissena polymorpha TaxID=45954 RepID=A0A9D4FYT3_DREPO|nr:hypothetical protein DPMN_134365 [Dreissena polymorpha]
MTTSSRLSQSNRKQVSEDETHEICPIFAEIAESFDTGKTVSVLDVRDKRKPKMAQPWKKQLCEKLHHIEKNRELQKLQMELVIHEFTLPVSADSTVICTQKTVVYYYVIFSLYSCIFVSSTGSTQERDFIML